MIELTRSRLLRQAFSPGLLFLIGTGLSGCLLVGGGSDDPASQEERVLEPLPAVPAVTFQNAGGEEAAFQVVVTRPTGEVGGTVRPTVTFSQPVVSMDMLENLSKLPPPATIKPAIPGSWRWIGSASVEFVPSAPLPMATEFTVTVQKNIRSLAGQPLANSTVFTFNTPRPKARTILPASGAAWVEPKQVFKLTLNQPLKNFQQAVSLTVKDGPGVPLELLKTVNVVEERKNSHAHGYDEYYWEDNPYKDRATRYEFQSKSPLPADTNFILSLKPIAQGMEGPLTAEAAAEWTYHTYGPLRFREAKACEFPSWATYDCKDGKCPCPIGPLVLMTTNRVKPESLKGRLTVQPPVDIDWEQIESSDGNENGPYVAIPGRFIPGTRYKVKVTAGAEDDYGQLATAFMAEIKTDDLAPSLSLDSTLVLIEASGDGLLPVATANVGNVSAQVWSLTPGDLARALKEDSFMPSSAPLTTTLNTSGSKNRPRWSGLDLRKPFPAGKKTGLFMASINSPELKPEDGYSRVIAQITDIAVHAKLGAARGVAWVTSLSTAKPIGGAKVELYDEEGQMRWSGTSGPDGVVVLPGVAGLFKAEYEWATPWVMLAATKGTDVGVTLSTWDGSFWPGAMGAEAGTMSQKAQGLGFVVSERGIYRPGEDVFVKGIARFLRLGYIGAPAAGTKATVTVTNSRDQEVSKKEVLITKYGTFSSSLTLPKDVPLGTASVSVEVPLGGDETLTYGTSFRIEEYRAPQFIVDMTAANESLLAGEKLEASILARYLFGGAMAGAHVDWTVQRETTEYAPPGFPAFDFGMNLWWYSDDEQPYISETFASGQGDADATGTFVLKPGVADASGARTWSYTLEADVEDVSRQHVADRASVIVHPADAYVGVRYAGDSFAMVGKPATLEMVAVSPDGKQLAGRALSLDIKLREWKSVRKRADGGGWYTESEPEETSISQCKQSSALTPVSCTFTPAKPGLYVLEASLVDGQGRKQETRTSVYVVGDGWVSWQRSGDDYVELVADKDQYEVGETAHILIKNPYPDANALFTLEREGVLEHRLMTLKGSAVMVDVPITEAMLPNLFAGVVILRGRVPDAQGLESGDDPGKPSVKAGYVSLKVNKESRRLNVQLTPDKQEYRPRDSVKLAVQVKDWKGKGVKTEVALWAVDEAVLRLTDYQLPDPITILHPSRDLSVRMAESLIHLVQRRAYQDKGFSPGGSGGMDSMGADMRSLFKTTPIFLPEVETDATGKAVVEFKLPDNLTTFRILALATMDLERFGTGQSSITVFKPLMLLPALPRLARVGDTFEAGVVIHTKGKDIPSVTVAAESKGLELIGQASRPVTLEQGRATEARFTFKAAAPGDAVLRFTVSGSGEKDGVEQRLPVKLPVQTEAVAVYGDTQTNRIEGLVPPSGVRQDVGGLELSLASTALGGFDESMRQLIDYPYGCLEQLSSRLAPFIALRELFGTFGVKYPSPAEAKKAMKAQLSGWLGEETLKSAGSGDPDEVIRSTVKKIEGLQTWTGGYKYWSTSVCESDWGSAYAVLALSRALELGYPVDKDALANGKKWLAEKVAAGKPSECLYRGVTPDDATRVFALYVLARVREAKPSYYAELYQRRQALPLFAKAMLANAMALQPEPAPSKTKSSKPVPTDRGLAKQLIQEILTFAQETPGEVHFAEKDPQTWVTTWSSDVRSTALVLQALLALQPEHPFVGKIARFLTKTRDTGGRYRSTQEAAFALMALSDMVRVKEKEVPDYLAKVVLGSQELLTASFKGRSTSIFRERLPMSSVVASAAGGAQAGTSQQFAFSKTGPGVLYYSALLRYAPSTMPTTPSDRGMIVQRWFEPIGGGGQSKTFQAGELIRVRVRVATPAERHFVAVDIPLPAGLEIVDTSLASTAKLAGALERSHNDEYSYQDESGEEGEEESEEAFNPWAFAFYNPFNHSEKRDDRLALFADDLPPGVHSSSFIARATTPGDFVLKPAYAEEMYAPEVNGRSDGGSFKILPGKRVASR